MASSGVESEIKLRVADAAATRAELARLGAQPALARHFEDNLLFDDARHDLSGSDRMLRLRQRVPGGWRVTYKGPRSVNAGVRSRPEIEVDVDDGTALTAILAGLGLTPVFRYQKFRETWRLGGVEVMLDETPLGAFLELEGAPEALPGVARALGYTQADFMTRSYVELYLAQGGQGDMLFP
jgi:adenylate cyclase class 2